MPEHVEFLAGRDAFEARAAKFGHKPTVKEVSRTLSLVSCSCGWKSQAYWDWVEFAYDDWKRHAQAALDSGQPNLPLDAK